ncbi:MAG: hypothetical protein C0403_05015 [Desulfobacterium sp.]|nr:hypothetical protein [Desulfobacterium sp.]
MGFLRKKCWVYVLAANSVRFSFSSICSFFQQNKEIKALCVHVEAEIVQIDSISINRGEYQMDTSLAINYLVFLIHGLTIGIPLLFSGNL